MFKTTLLGLSLASLLTAGVALAADAVKVEPGTGPTETMTKAVPAMTPPATGAAATSTATDNCTQAELTAMITKAGALTDKDKQKMTMGHLDMAKKSMDEKDMAACAMHMKEASAGLGTVTK
jgi:hypothetical protein